MFGVLTGTRRPTTPDLQKAWAKAKKTGRKIKKTAPIEWRHYVRALPIRSTEVFYESFAGNGALCHPEAIFRELLSAPDLRHLEHVWVLDDVKRQAATAAMLAEIPHVRVVERNSFAYFRHLATAKFLVNNATFPTTFNKRPGQIYLNTWHGTPLKRMGFDEPSGAASARNTVRNFLQADYVVSGSPYMTETMFEGAYRLDNIAPNLRIIDEGNPRTDRQILDESGREQVRQQLRGAGLDVSTDDTVVLYAPTWKGSSFHTPQDESEALARDVTALQKVLPAGHVVLLKVHQQVFDASETNPEIRERLVPNFIPTNLVLGLTDILVTDYSSIFFDFIVTGRPVLFHTPDLDEYVGTRGLYLDEAELPGPRVATVTELAERISAVGTGSALDPLATHRAEYAKAVQRFAPHDDGGAAGRVVDIVFRGREQGRRVAAPRRDDKPRILLYLGGMKSNGITASALNLLSNIDTDRFDVTALFDHGKGDRRLNIASIPARIRPLARTGGFQPGKVHWFRRRRFTEKGASMQPKDLEAMLSLLEQEWHRVMGASEFDHIIDFSGYSPFWSFLMAEGSASSRAIWQHNDLKADQMRMVDGKRPHEKHLGSVFSSYYLYDRLVSVSPALRDINAEHLSEFAPGEKFVSARNLIDAPRIRSAVVGDPALRDAWPGDHLLTYYDPDVDPEVRATLWNDNERFRPEMARRWAQSRSPRKDGVFQFVTVGRLSPEKNHERLIRAFEAVHREDPNTRLVIIGAGPLEARLEDVVHELGLEDSVVLTGLLRNPWALMVECDAFVLSSDYEGQPMVILEARVLGLPVLSTAFGSARGAIDDGVDGRIVDRSVEGLAEGMRELLRHEVPNPTFDPDAYNAEALAEFYRATGITQDRAQIEAALD